MLAVDWLGVALTAGVLLLGLPGSGRHWRAALVLLLGEIGRVAALWFLGGQVAAVTIGGAFTRVSLTGPPQRAVQLGGLLVGVVLSLLFGYGAARDSLIYALLAGVALLLVFT